MWDTIQNLRLNSNCADAAHELNSRLNDRMELPLPGLRGEKLYLTGIASLEKRAAELKAMYDKLRIYRDITDIVLLDAWSSASIDGITTTLDYVKNGGATPKSKEERIVLNIASASNYSHRTPITNNNIRKLWFRIVDGVCENTAFMGAQFRDGMIYSDVSSQISHIPAAPNQLPELMEKLFTYLNLQTENVLIQSFVAHFYIIYTYPFCDGNAKLARVVNTAHLMSNGYQKMRKLPLSNAILKQQDRYYASLADSKYQIKDAEENWIDISPFVSYMMDAFERCLIDAELSVNVFSNTEKRSIKMGLSH